jgi:hypothetical protein
MRVFNIVMDWLMAVIAATVITCWAHSWRVQTHLLELGVQIPPQLMMKTVMQDAFGMGPAVAGIYAIALGLAFIIAVLAMKRVPLGPYLAFPLAGMVAIGLTLWLMKLSYDITPLAGARDPAGFAAMVFGGALAGFVFAYFRPKAPVVLT